MADALTNFIRQTLPDGASEVIGEKLDTLEKGQYLELLSLPHVRNLVDNSEDGQTESSNSTEDLWQAVLKENLNRYLEEKKTKETDVIILLIAAIAALQAFMQANVTGPPLSFDPGAVLFPKKSMVQANEIKALRSKLRIDLSRDGESVYKLTPHIELLYFACNVLEQSRIQGIPGAEWALLRARFAQQKLLSEISSSLQREIYDYMATVDQLISTEYRNHSPTTDMQVSWLLEKAAIETYHGFDKEARKLLNEATKLRNFTFALTGVMGKRTKYQEKETSQLVVLARSENTSGSQDNGSESSVLSNLQESQATDNDREAENTKENAKAVPSALELNDDTLLERIEFTSNPKYSDSSSTSIQPSTALPPSLASLDPSKQPLLAPLDSVILLSLASSITNTQPSDGLTREETLPYAQRVLDSGSSNWQIYTQALLVRSRIEGYRARTANRGVLQFQALVDQIIVETTSKSDVVDEGVANVTTTIPSISINGMSTDTETKKPTSFLPAPKPTESVPASVRLQYIQLLNTPYRWQLESELAARWTTMGMPRTALEIYERLEMWAEVALCWAAAQQEEKATRIIRSLLFQPSAVEEGQPKEVQAKEEAHTDLPLTPQPSDAPRLYCILADLTATSTILSPTQAREKAIAYYQTAWSISSNRYSRAQRSIARLYYQVRYFRAAALAYTKALHTNQTHAPSWFALGCCLLELEAWERAADAFRRAVSLDETDAESWSNLAAALVRLYEKEKAEQTSAEASVEASNERSDDLSNDGANRADTNRAESLETAAAETSSATITQKDPQAHLKSALSSLKRAAQISHDSLKIQENLLTISLSLKPPAWTEVLTAQNRVIELAGPTRGERCIDIEAVTGLYNELVKGPAYWTTSTSNSSLPSSSNPAEKEGDEEDTGSNSNSSSNSEKTRSREKRTVNPAMSKGFPRLFLSMLETAIIPLITSNTKLWKIVASVRMWQDRPGACIEAYERAWRVSIGLGSSGSGSLGVDGGGPNGENGDWTEDPAAWDRVVIDTIGLVDIYESLGPLWVGGGELIDAYASLSPRDRGVGGWMENGEGVGGRDKQVEDKWGKTGDKESIDTDDDVETQDLVQVLPDHRFKSRSAIRLVLGRAKESWEGNERYVQLQEMLRELKQQR